MHVPLNRATMAVVLLLAATAPGTAETADRDSGTAARNIAGGVAAPDLPSAAGAADHFGAHTESSARNSHGADFDGGVPLVTLSDGFASGRNLPSFCYACEANQIGMSTEVQYYKLLTNPAQVKLVSIEAPMNPRQPPPLVLLLVAGLAGLVGIARRR